MALHMVVWQVRVDTKTAVSLNAHQFRTNYEAFLRGIEKSNGPRPENVMALQVSHCVAAHARPPF